MEDLPLKIIQISDIHLFADKEKSLLGVKTNDSFAAVIELLKKNNENPALMLLTGDLSQDGSKESYLRLADMLKDFSIPIYYVPGNHDDEEMLAQVYPIHNITHHRHIVLKHWHIILLDSHQPRKVPGFLDHAQLTFLEHCLQMYPEHHAMIVFHHHPVSVGSAWLDKIGLLNTEEFWPILYRFPNVHSVLFGHVHQQHAGEKNGIHYFSVPSTCIQFKTNSDIFALEKLPPGYGRIELSSDGTMKTEVVRHSHYIGEFDINAKGY